MIIKKFNKLKMLITGAVLLPALLLTACSEKDNGTKQTIDDFLNSNTPSTANGNTGEMKLETGNLYAVISVKDYGDITVKLFPDIAPTAVANFVNSALDGYYDGKNFHRIMSNFMIQGGSLNGDGMSDANGVKYGVERNINARHYYGAIAMGKNALGENGLQFYIVNSKNENAFTDLLADLESYESLVEQYKEVMNQIEEHKKENGEDGLNMSAVAQYTDEYGYYSALVDYLKNSGSEITDKYNENGGVAFLDGGYTVFGQTVDGFDVIDKISAVEVQTSASNPDEKSTPVKEVLIDKVVIKTYE